MKRTEAEVLKELISRRDDYFKKRRQKARKVLYISSGICVFVISFNLIVGMFSDNRKLNNNFTEGFSPDEKKEVNDVFDSKPDEEKDNVYGNSQGSIPNFGSSTSVPNSTEKTADEDQTSSPNDIKLGNESGYPGFDPSEIISATVFSDGQKTEINNPDDAIRLYSMFSELCEIKYGVEISQDTKNDRFYAVFRTSTALCSGFAEKVTEDIKGIVAEY